MLFAVHADALHELLVTNPPSGASNPLYHSRLSVTTGILADYEATFATSVTETQLYQSFIGSMAGRLKSVPAKRRAPYAGLHPDYLDASRSGGRNMSLASGQTLCAIAAQDFVQLGIRFGALASIFGPEANIGYRPFETHLLSHRGTKSPTIIARFFEGEERVTFYDKFINAKAISAINVLAASCSPSASLTIVTSRHAQLSVEQIRSTVARRRGQTLSVEVAHPETLELIHDRHIFIGDDVEIHIARGLDVFGTRPNWRNASSKIDVYDSSLGGRVQIRFATPTARRPMIVRSCVIS